MKSFFNTRFLSKLICLIVAIIIFFVIFGNRFDFDKISSRLGLFSTDLTATDNNIYQKAFKEPVSYGSLTKTYNSEHNFSFRYPEGFKVLFVSSTDLNSIITVENEKGNGFQIFILPFDEPNPITKERIWRDMQDMEINNIKEADLDGIETIVFDGYDEALGETFEVWPVYKGRLYQITAPKGAKDLLIEVLETWSWK